MRSQRTTSTVVLCIAATAAVLATPSVAIGAAPLGPGGDVAFVSVVDGDSDIYLADVDGGDVVNLTDHPAADYDPRWSPDGRDLAFVSDRDGAAALYVLSSGVMVAPNENLQWSWSPDGRSIAWVSHEGFRDLWVTDVASGDARNVTDGSMEAWAPQWAPDSATIYFEAIVGGGDRMITSVSAAGGNPVPVAPGSPFDLSPGGTRLVVGGSALSVMDSDGTDAVLLATAAENHHFEAPAWSPDGSLIAYGDRLVQGSPALQIVESHVIPAAGGEPTAIARGSTPSWAPTGNHLVIYRIGMGNLTQDVVVATPDASSSIELAAPDPESGCAWSASWSPDGARVAFEAFRCATASPPPRDVYIANADGTAVTHIAMGHSPAWRPAPYHVGLVDPATGVWRLNGIAPFYFGNPGDVPFLGDWDGDGIVTPGLYRRSDGYVYLRNSNTQGVADVRFFFGNPGDLPLAGDFDGDGFDTVSVYRPSTGQVFVVDELGSEDAGLGAADHQYYFGDPGDKPFVGDFDGDGVDTVGLHRESTGFVYLRNSHTQGIADAAFFFGDPGDRLVACDWEEDGTDSVGVYRPGTTTFHLRFTNSQGNADTSFVVGRPSWLPVCGVVEG